MEYYYLHMKLLRHTRERQNLEMKNAREGYLILITTLSPSLEKQYHKTLSFLSNTNFDKCLDKWEVFIFTINFLIYSIMLGKYVTHLIFIVLNNLKKT